MEALQWHIRVPKLAILYGFGTDIGLSDAPVAHPCAKTAAKAGTTTEAGTAAGKKTEINPKGSKRFLQFIAPDGA